MGTIWKARKRGVCSECHGPIKAGETITNYHSATQDWTKYAHLVCPAGKRQEVDCESGKSEIAPPSESL